MHLDDDERRILAKIESSLTDADPDFSRIFRRAQRFLPPRQPSWPAITASAALLLAAASAVAVSSSLAEPLLLIAAAALFLPAVAVVLISIRRATRAPTRRARSRRNRHSLTRTPDEPAEFEHAVVVATDGKPHSDAALRYAADEAERRGATLVVVTSYLRPIDPDLPEIATPAGEVQMDARRLATEALRRAFSSGSSLPDHRIVAEHGDVCRRLLRDFRGAEVIVVGSHRRRLMSRVLHRRTTSDELVRHSPVPVVVVPPSWS